MRPPRGRGPHRGPDAARVPAGAHTAVHSAKEFDLLYILAANPERVVSRKDLMKKVWESDGVMCSRTIDTHVSSLRAKLGSEWIVTVRGVGYRIGQGYKRTELRRDDRMQEVGAVGESV
jgi:DNA-binding response OmpR family regulator